MQEKANAMAAVAARIHEACTGMSTPDEKALVETALKCYSVAQKLEDKARAITKDQKKGSVRKALWVRTKYIWEKANLEELEHTSTESSWKRNSFPAYDFNTLAINLQHFIAQIAAGHKQMEDLVQKEHGLTREAVKSAQAVLSTVIHDTHNKTVNEQQRQRLIGSFKFLETNKRYQDILNKGAAHALSSDESTGTNDTDSRFRCVPLNNDPCDLDTAVGQQKTRDDLPDSAFSSDNDDSSETSTDQSSTQDTSEIDHPSQMIHLMIGRLMSCMRSLYAILTKGARAVCIFIDGLDEVCDSDGPEPLLDLIDSLHQYPGVKVCVSSRPETAFERRFKGFVGLRLQDLNKPDIKRYINTELDTVQKFISDDLRKKLATLLLHGADGIFLWLHLAMRSIKKGIQNRNSEEELCERLRTPNGDLYKLYEDMWLRLQDDEPTYRASAAEYFTLILASREESWLQMHTKDSTMRPGFSFDQLSLFEIMVVRNPRVREALLSSLSTAEVSSNILVDYCKNTQFEIENRCAGLLEVLPNEYTLEKASVMSPNFLLESGLFYQFAAEVRFVHRTAHDFFTDTEPGQRILGNVDRSPIKSHGSILREQLCMAHAAYQHFDLESDIGHFVQKLASLARAEGLVKQAELTPISAEILLHLRNAYDNEIVVDFFQPIRSYWRRLRGDRFLLLSWLASCSEFDDLISSSVTDQASSSLATRVLWEMWCIYAYAGAAAPSRKLTEAIMAAGGDPHTAYDSPWVPYCPRDSSNGDLDCLVRQNTAFSFLLEGNAWRYTRRGAALWMYVESIQMNKDDAESEILDIAETMAEHCLHMSQTITLVGELRDDLVELLAPVPYITDGDSDMCLVFFEASTQLLLLLMQDYLKADAWKYPQMPPEVDQSWIKLRFVRPAYDSYQDHYYLRVRDTQLFHKLITNVFPGDLDAFWGDSPSKYGVQQLMERESEMERLDVTSMPHAFDQELQDCHLRRDVSNAVLCLLVIQSVAQVTEADLPECSLVCWDVPPSNSSPISCQFDSVNDFEKTLSPCFYEQCTPEQALSALNVTSLICDVPVRDVSLGMRVFCVVATLVSSLVIGARVILKVRSLAGELGWDDWCIVIAVVVVLDAAVGQYLAAHYGLGRDQWKVPFQDIEKAFKFFYVSTVGYKLGNMFTRMSVLCFYLRLFSQDTKFRRTTYGIMIVNVCVGISFVVVDLTQCLPVSYVWNGWTGEHQGRCSSISAITLSHSVLNILLDAVTLAMAVWMVKGLQMRLRKKASVIGLFVLGSAITLVTFLRLQALPHLKNARNRTWGLAPLAYWSAIEIAAGLILACLPALKKLRYIFRRKEQITYISSNSGSRTGPAALRSNREASRARHLSDHLGHNSGSYAMMTKSETTIDAQVNELADLTKSIK
ncbi:Satratoxin biosynthesis SC6 cluster protein [Paramyrothecium foliicola]|nr:Satratoxin biosynthesis SC6 cluster protein [Paramyrothecium foliicola]